MNDYPWYRRPWPALVCALGLIVVAAASQSPAVGKDENHGHVTVDEALELHAELQALKQRFGKVDADLHGAMSDLLAYEELLVTAYVYDEPAPADPPADPPAGSVEWPDPSSFGCQVGANTLVSWEFQPISGAGLPSPPLPPVADGAVYDGFHFWGTGYTYLGIFSIIDGSAASGVTFQNAVVGPCNKWGGNGDFDSVSVKNVTYTDIFPEHVAYFKPRPPLPPKPVRPFTFTNVLSRDIGSQGLQVALRQWEHPEGFGDPIGDIIVDGWYMENHGGGDRESQCWKVFSAQAGTKDDQWAVQLNTRVDMRGLWLDDSMRETDVMGALYAGDAVDFDVHSIHAKGGELAQSAVVVTDGSGPFELGDEGWSMFYDSAESGRGIKIKELSRPVKIHPGEGNLLIRGPDGETLAHITEGWTSSTWAE